MLHTLAPFYQLITQVHNLRKKTYKQPHAWGLIKLIILTGTYTKDVLFNKEHIPAYTSYWL